MQRNSVLKSRGMQLVERRLGRPMEDVLRELYVDQGLTVKQVGKTLGVSGPTVSRWMADLGIEARFLGPRTDEAVA